MEQRLAFRKVRRDCLWFGFLLEYWGDGSEECKSPPGFHDPSPILQHPFALMQVAPDGVNRATLCSVLAEYAKCARLFSSPQAQRPAERAKRAFYNFIF